MASAFRGLSSVKELELVNMSLNSMYVRVHVPYICLMLMSPIPQGLFPATPRLGGTA